MAGEIISRGKWSDPFQTDRYIARYDMNRRYEDPENFRIFEHGGDDSYRQLWERIKTGAEVQLHPHFTFQKFSNENSAASGIKVFSGILVKSDDEKIILDLGAGDLYLEDSLWRRYLPMANKAIRLSFYQYYAKIEPRYLR